MINYWIKNHTYLNLWHFVQILISAKPLRIKFDKVDELITVYDGTKIDCYLVL